MTDTRLLLCTDMDRTVIPNGVQSEHPQARQCFSEFCSQPQVVLAYVTGRHQKLVQQAIKLYSLPQPSFAITDVGSKIYQVHQQHWQPLEAWEAEIDRDWNGKSHQDLKELFRDLSDLHMQEFSKQNTHKLSYYISPQQKLDKVLQIMQQRLDQEGVQASLVFSIDEPKGTGLLDVLPRNATKLHAIDFLRRQLDFELSEVVFAGDSGNDLHVLESEIPSVLVANASDEVRAEALSQAKKFGHEDALYLASGHNPNNNGNYTAGVLEGVCHYMPGFRRQLVTTGFCHDE